MGVGPWGGFTLRFVARVFPWDTLPLGGTVPDSAPAALGGPDGLATLAVVATKHDGTIAVTGTAHAVVSTP